jgi:exopolysaccharide biosynthesis polyprenyl glycosylphosphotransferase
VFSGALIGLAAIIVFVFYFRPAAFSRLLFGYVWLAIVVLLPLVRWLERLAVDWLRRRGHGLRRTLIVGAGPLGRLIMQAIIAQPDLGYRVVGFVDDERSEPIGRFPALGPLRRLPDLITAERVDEVIIALPAKAHKDTLAIMDLCRHDGVRFRIVPDFYELSLDVVHVEDVGGIPLIGLRTPRLSRWDRGLKRALDIALGSIFLALSAPLWPLIALAVRLESPGPIIFRQVRVGRGGAHFVAYKFRSMVADAEADYWKAKLAALNESNGPTFKMRDDPRLTRVGRIIRRLSLDELPQLVNVLRGEMSLVGPRPPVPREVEQYNDWHRRRLEVAPGVTGLWQVSGRSALTFDEMVLLDLWYIEHWSLLLDLKILLRTIPAVLLARGAY